ncbi:peroxiredoxin 5, atypical 2-Cys peroxiredoxin [Nannochloropsis gaditana CCMP526]|uniref:Peroxiredoxin-2e-chloroplastic n=1 Tax=Nannochloropsis gaditana TaxID=72520 RepID=W7TRA4_9STRA|nr:peroxiredoxin 5, atypical 2-Cys peroxiredoxin [Nannochloropsis gaditana CCMP526]EKU23114.1 peroxiredoxin 5, atypical 2-Cys peroxiredoxin [Nannochloropsis gaditana CCMP526]EWM26023.1 peroxiredoxin-2e- chloroplastic [Nannochloropsis gaditana]|eukprot:XP_005852718.1 peroxiredoxin 5, atypical 2-Cys peroxiredoxin [Nannochloropsis gaditana CCMP526]
MAKIAEGQTLPLEKITFKVLKDGKATDLTGTDLFKGKKVVLFGVPGAFTPTCTNTHAPEYLAMYESFKAKGVDAIYCIASNDCFVTSAWAKSLDAGDKVSILADGDCGFAKLVGLTVETGGFGGLRLSRFSALVEDGSVKKLHLEEGGGYTGVSGAEQMLKDLE